MSQICWYFHYSCLPSARSAAFYNGFWCTARSTSAGKYFHLPFARCQLLAHRPKIRATVVPVGKARDIHHQLCVEASVLALCAERLWNVPLQVPPSDIQSLRPRDASIAGVVRLSDLFFVNCILQCFTCRKATPRITFSFPSLAAISMQHCFLVGTLAHLNARVTFDFVKKATVLNISTALCSWS